MSLDAFVDEIGDSGPVSVAGAGTRWDLGGPLDPSARVVTAPAGVVEYLPDEMTVTVLAGTPVHELSQVLADRGQRCALPERGGTVGGAVVVGENHLEVLGRGTLRASVLQVRYVSAEGRLVKGGGPTVKNVSGFDIPRLMTGSLGTLGMIGEVILRTNPIPATSVWLESSDADPFAVADAVLRPGVILWNGMSTRVLVEGHAPDVTGAIDALGTLGTWNECDGPFDCPPHRWSLEPADLRSLDGTFVASVGVGTAWRDIEQPRCELPGPVLEISRRLKSNFDPSGRLNPGRSVI
jgi:glycolate oxidase FAD binding subunit